MQMLSLLRKTFNRMNVISFGSLFRKRDTSVVIDGTEYQLASFDRRMIAGIVDIIWIIIVSHPISLFMEFITGISAKRQEIIRNAPVPVLHRQDITNAILDAIDNDVIDNWTVITFLLYQGAMLLIVAIMMAVFWIKKRGQTPAKMLLHCRVVDAQTAAQVTTKQAVVRALAMIPSIGLFGLGLVGISFSKRNRSLHDALSDTIVIFEPKKKQKPQNLG